ncbi:hypothetical protein ABEB36_006478 [Hypothenemus hampei]|uniref:CHK kinase-like domain-containing protein n=1 Tax=Hypothenemus hampei TaxID=57062 RepID=A0ABD1ERE1_HYPHA
MSSLNLTREQRVLIDRAAAQHALKQYEILTEIGSTKGDNYLGVLHIITLRDSTGKQISLILKTAPLDDAVRLQGRMPQVFKREAFIYGKILPEFQQIQKEYGIKKPFLGAATYYGSDLTEKQESILMENLKLNDYQLCDRTQPMNEEHIIVVFSEYARFHAASFALRHLRKEKFEELTKDIHYSVFQNPTANPEETAKVLENYVEAGVKSIKGNTKAVAALEKMKLNIMDLFKNSMVQGRERFVVVHGDCWCNNMLFKYREKNPSDVCFIDWQLSQLASPVKDLAYFFSVSGSKETYRNLNRYLEIYYRVLSENLKEFKLNPEEIFSFQDLMEEWNNNAYYGVFISLMVLKLMLSNSDEAPTLQGAYKGESILASLTNFQTTKSSEYERRLVDLIEFMADNKYI